MGYQSCFVVDNVVDKRLGGETWAYEDMTEMLCSLSNNHNFVKMEHYGEHYQSAVRCRKRPRV